MASRLIYVKAAAQSELERSGILAGAEDATIEQVHRLSDILGKEIRFYDGNTRTDSSVTANGYEQGGILYINSRSGNPVAQIVAHELTHTLENAESYIRLNRHILRHIAETENLSELRQAKQELYARNGQTLDDKEAEREIVAEYVEKHLLTDEESIRTLVQEDRTLGQVIKNWLDRLLAKLRNQNAQERVFLTKARDLYAMALKETESGRTVRQAAQDASSALNDLRTAYAKGEITEEEFNGALDDVMQSESEAGELAEERRFSFSGTTQNGVEVYETSEEVRTLPYKERMARFVDIMREQYRGRTAKFVANGDVYYARFDERDISKNIYGDKKSSPRGWKAKINTGADGSIFELVENARYKGNDAEFGKTTAAHKDVTGWEYFVKTVQIDGQVYDLLANVRKKLDGEYVYSIQLNENKNKAPAPPVAPAYTAANAEDGYASEWVPTDAIRSIPQNGEEGKRNFIDLSYGNDYTADVVVGTRKNGSMILYDILNLKPTAFTKKEMSAAISANPSPGAASNTADISMGSLSQNGEKGKRNFSFGEDAWELRRDEAERYAHELAEDEVEEKTEHGAFADDEAARQAKRNGFPVIKGVQIVPYNTWVHPRTGKLLQQNDISVAYEDVIGAGKVAQNGPFAYTVCFPA